VTKELKKLRLKATDGFQLTDEERKKLTNGILDMAKKLKYSPEDLFCEVYSLAYERGYSMGSDSIRRR